MTNHVTFSGLLNAIDGIAGQEGKLVFLTTNHPDQLDEALIRPGRVDCKAEFGLATCAAAEAFFIRFYSDPDATNGHVEHVATLAAKFAAKVPDGLYSMAVYQAHLMRYQPFIEYFAFISPLLVP
jgi:SpoVK/Ycf46/Vps4 family AAA+-type ATPase